MSGLISVVICLHLYSWIKRTLRSSWAGFPGIIKCLVKSVSQEVGLSRQRVITVRRSL